MLGSAQSGGDTMEHEMVCRGEKNSVIADRPCGVSLTILSVIADGIHTRATRMHLDHQLERVLGGLYVVPFHSAGCTREINLSCFEEPAACGNGLTVLS